MYNIYFTSDTHLNHANIIRYSSRPFSSVEEMDETLIANWNSRVKDKDIIYHLGDLAFAPPKKIEEYVRRLNGIKYFIKGNHDKSFLKSHATDHFQWIKDYFELKVDGQLIVLFHYPLQSFNKQHHGSWHLHGHCHGKIPSNEWQKRLDVGVDVHNYFPISFEKVREHMSQKLEPKYDGQMDQD